MIKSIMLVGALALLTSACQSPSGGISVAKWPPAPEVVLRDASALRWVVVSDANPQAVNLVSGLTDRLLTHQCRVVQAEGFAQLQQELDALLAQPMMPHTPGQGLLQYGADVIIVVRPVPQAPWSWRICALDTAAAPLMDTIVRGATASEVGSLVSQLVERANQRYPVGEFELVFRGLPGGAEDQLGKLLHTLPDVTRTDLLIRQNPVGGESASRWRVSGPRLSNVQIQSRLQQAVQRALQEGRFLLDGQPVALTPESQASWPQLQAFAVGSRLIAFRSNDPTVARPRSAAVAPPPPVPVYQPAPPAVVYQPPPLQSTQRTVMVTVAPPVVYPAVQSVPFPAVRPMWQRNAVPQWPTAWPTMPVQVYR